MEFISIDLTSEAGIMFLLGCFIVGISAGVRFSHPSFDTLDLISASSPWLKRFKQIFLTRTTGNQVQFVPPRAHTTVFRYRLYQGAYIVLGVFIY